MPLVVQDTNSFARGHELFRGGLLTEAVLALEAEVQRKPGNVPAWLLLGTIQAENDDDLQVGAHMTISITPSVESPSTADSCRTIAASLAGLVRHSLGRLGRLAGHRGLEPSPGGGAQQRGGAAVDGRVVHQ